MDDEKSLVGDVAAFVRAFNTDDLDSARKMLSTEFWTYEPREGEPDQREAFGQVMGEVRRGLPDASLVIAEVRDHGPHLRADVVLAGHYTGTMFSVTGLGQAYELRAGLQARESDDGLVLAFDGVEIPAVLRTLGVIPYLSFGHLRPEQPGHLPEVLYRLAFGGNALEEKPCSHLDQINFPDPMADICVACVDDGVQWPALRQCLTCGHVGCCDLSINKHARRHSEETGHALARSVEPGESWIWCYPDAAILSSWHLTAGSHPPTGT